MEATFRDGWIAPELRDEFPELRLVWTALAVRPGRSPRELKDRLRDLSNTVRGSNAMVLRQQPIPWAYRVFYRHIGLDPDRDRTPIEAAILERLHRGRFPSRGLVDDALAASLIETGVPLFALDADQLVGDGGLGLRPVDDGERLGEELLPAGRIAVVDSRGPVAALFGDPSPEHVVTKRTRRLALFAIQVKGVPVLHVEEALEQCREWLEAWP